MADHSKTLNQYGATLATAVTAMNSALAAEIVTVSPQPLQCVNLSCLIVDISSTVEYGVAVAVKYQG